MTSEIVIEECSEARTRRALQQSFPSCELLLRSNPGGAVATFEEYRVHRDESREMVYLQPALVLVTRGQGKVVVRRNNRRCEYRGWLESALLFPTGFNHICQPAAGSGFTCVTFDPYELNECADELGMSAGPIDPKPILGHRDGVLVQLMQGMRMLASQGTEQFSRLLKESLSRAMLARFLELSCRTIDLAPIKDEKAALRQRLRRAMEAISDDPARDIGLSELAAYAHLSPSHLTRCFKSVIGMSPAQFQRHRRIEMAIQLMETTHLSQQSIAEAVGFTSVQGFRKAYRCVAGKPLTRRKGL